MLLYIKIILSAFILSAIYLAAKIVFGIKMIRAEHNIQGLKTKIAFVVTLQEAIRIFLLVFFGVFILGTLYFGIGNLLGGIAGMLIYWVLSAYAYFLAEMFVNKTLWKKGSLHIIGNKSEMGILIMYTVFAATVLMILFWKLGTASASEFGGYLLLSVFAIVMASFFSAAFVAMEEWKAIELI